MSYTGESKPGQARVWSSSQGGRPPGQCKVGVCLWAFRGPSGLKGNDLSLADLLYRLPCLVLGGYGPKTQRRPKVLFPLGLLPLSLSSSLWARRNWRQKEAERLGRRTGERGRVSMGSRLQPESPCMDQRPGPQTRAAGARLSITGEGREFRRSQAGWTEMGEMGSGPVSLAPGAVCSQGSSWPLFMACPVPFSKLEMTAAVLIFFPTQGPVSVSLHLLSLWPNVCLPEELSPGLSWGPTPK